ncbi:hypothetical protein DF153_18340 [Burkholderia cenocepacia]|nr:hypothetical protein DF152_19805 [Burkholderia cenocepacia]RQU23436.1 hypothetical protein DF153_18340 [Burkholderia cenocepacia]
MREFTAVLSPFQMDAILSLLSTIFRLFRSLELFMILQKCAQRFSRMLNFPRSQFLIEAV